MPTSSFAPAHLTGLFKIYANTSAGAGVTLQHGMHTGIRTSPSGKNGIFINGEKSSAPVSNCVISKFSGQLDPVPFEVRHNTPLPIGCGLGMSAAGALSLSLALNEWCGRPFSHDECVQIAHDADVACGTGLASADVQAIGGLVSRKGARGAPDVLRLSRRDLSTPVHLAVFGPLRTSSVIRSKSWKVKVNKAGTSALSEFYHHRSMFSLMHASNQFALRSGLGNWAKKSLQASPAVGMAMLGKTLFYQGENKPNFAGLAAAPALFKTYPTNRAASVI